MNGYSRLIEGKKNVAHEFQISDKKEGEKKKKGSVRADFASVTRQKVLRCVLRELRSVHGISCGRSRKEKLAKEH